jgi:uncharacterized protein
VTATTPKPQFRTLDDASALRVLERQHVGRIAFARRDRIDVVPLHYVYEDGWIFGRTTFGEKLEHIHSNWWAAFQVDEIDGIFDWRSVIVHGGFYIFDPEAGPHDAELYERALAALRRIVPETLTADDPVPERTLVFGMAVQEITGRAAESSTQTPQDRGP